MAGYHGMIEDECGTLPQHPETPFSVVFELPPTIRDRTTVFGEMTIGRRKPVVFGDQSHGHLVYVYSGQIKHCTALLIIIFAQIT